MLALADAHGHARENGADGVLALGDAREDGATADRALGNALGHGAATALALGHAPGDGAAAEDQVRAPIFPRPASRIFVLLRFDGLVETPWRYHVS